MNRPSNPTADSLATAIEALGRGHHGTQAQTQGLVDGVLAGSVELAAFGEWLVALSEVGESAEEIAGVAAAIRGRMLRVPHSHPVVADTCGTGGDGSGSFNISTAAAIVVAAAGLPVAKHGNRAVTSRTGSADVLEHLGVRVDGPPATAARCLAELGLAFCLAPVYLPAMARVGPLRRSLGRPTVFNLVGPLCNPAGATVQVIGVGRSAAREPMAHAAVLGGAARALVVSGWLSADGSQSLDEVSLFGPSEVLDVSAAGVRRLVWTPEDFGLETQPLERLAELAVDGPAESALAIRAVLGGVTGPRRNVVVLNAAAVLWAAGKAPDLPAACQAAAAAIDSGAAAAKLAALAQLSQEAPGASAGPAAS